MFRDKSNQPTFPGFVEPSMPFDDVRDGRRSTLFYYDVDLTNARSIAAGTPLILNLAGNSFYVDQDTNTVGYGTVHFQDTNLGISPAPIYVGPGFIANVPFTQLLIENTAQAGKRLRIFYGVDIDFQAGVNAQIAITGSIAISTIQTQNNPFAIQYSGSYKSRTPMAALTPDTIFTPAANVNGAILHSGYFHTYSAVNTQFSVIAKNAAPVSLIDGDVLISGISVPNGVNCYAQLNQPIKIAPGKGLYYIPLSAEALGGNTEMFRSCLYTLL